MQMSQCIWARMWMRQGNREPWGLWPTGTHSPRGSSAQSHPPVPQGQPRFIVVTCLWHPTEAWMFLWSHSILKTVVAEQTEAG
jgi:hypothetical protein